jgi:hypothetical protein
VAKWVNSSQPSWNNFEEEQYNTFMKMQKNNEWQWSNFTWQYTSISTGTKIGWKINFIDTSGNINCTDIMSFEINDDLYINDLQSKWNYISVPFNQSINKNNLIIKYNGYNYSWQEAVDSKIVLNFIYEWNRSSQSYEIVDTILPGFGYWIYSYHICELWAQIEGGFETDTFVTNLKTSWNVVGIPEDKLMHKENLTVYYNDTMYTWQEAVNNNILLDYIYLWNESYQNYQISDVFVSGKAHWVYAYIDCRLLKPSL